MPTMFQNHDMGYMKIVQNKTKKVFFNIVLCAVFSLVLCCPGVRAEEKGGLAIKYVPSIQGAPDKDIKNTLTSISDTFNMKKNLPASLSMLNARVDGDLANMTKALHAEGYFRAKVDKIIDDKVSPVKVIFTVETGPAFILDHIVIGTSYGFGYYCPQLPQPSDLSLKPGTRYNAKKVLEAEAKILDILGNSGYPHPKIADRQITADHATNTVNITFMVDPGRRAVFGTTQIGGLENLVEDYVRNRILWHQGQIYKASDLVATKAVLLGTGLFSMVDIKRGEVTPKGLVPIDIKLKERAFRTVSVGGGYSTDKGIEGRFKWEHRNWLGGGEKIFASVQANEVEKIFKTGLRKPDFISPKQTFLLDGDVIDEQTDAYDSQSASVSMGVERNIYKQLKAGTGVKYRLVHVDEVDSDKKERYGLISLPTYANLDYTDNLLDAGKGGRLNIHMAPYLDTMGNSPDFFSYRLAYSHYLQIMKERRLILAGRALWGSKIGAIQDQMPKDELFYAGGGGSVRGYAYQYAGDVTRNSDGDLEPEGGLSLFEVSGEVRLKFTPSIGMVTFLDGGRAFASEGPDLNDELFWGTGLGLRYFTPIGPIRMDVAFPLDKREGIDDDYQIYLSLGQSF